LYENNEVVSDMTFGDEIYDSSLKTLQLLRVEVFNDTISISLEMPNSDLGIDNSESSPNITSKWIRTTNGWLKSINYSGFFNQ